MLGRALTLTLTLLGLAACQREEEPIPDHFVNRLPTVERPRPSWEVNEEVVRRYIAVEQSLLAGAPAERRALERLETERHEAAGLSNPQIRIIRRIWGSAASAAEWEPREKKLLEAVHAAAREASPEGRAGFAELERRVDADRNLAGERKEFGDGAVDAVLRHRGELAALYARRAKLVNAPAP